MMPSCPPRRKTKCCFELTVTKAWLRQVIVALPLICHSSYRGVIEFLRDLLGVSISMGTIHNLLQSAARQAGVINHEQELSGIPVGLHDEIFQGSTPVLAGVCAASTYCYLLVAAEHRDADTWGVHLLDAASQGLKSDYTIADAGQGLRAGQKAAWGETPCHGDVFHIQHEYEGLANTLSRLARGARSCRQRLEDRTNRAGQHGPDDELAIQLVSCCRKRIKSLCGAKPPQKLRWTNAGGGRRLTLWRFYQGRRLPGLIIAAQLGRTGWCDRSIAVASGAFKTIGSVIWSKAGAVSVATPTRV